MSAVIKLDTTGLDEIAAKLDMRTEQVLKAAAFQVEAEAKNRAPVITGYLKNSIKAKRINASTYHVEVGADYGIHVEFGHLTKPFRKSYGVQRFVAAKPFLRPAVEVVRKQLEDLYRRVLFP